MTSTFRPNSLPESPEMNLFDLTGRSLYDQTVCSKKQLVLSQDQRGIAFDKLRRRGLQQETISPVPRSARNRLRQAQAARFAARNN
jgi:hypothetical protein